MRMSLSRRKMCSSLRVPLISPSFLLYDPNLPRRARYVFLDCRFFLHLSSSFLIYQSNHLIDPLFPRKSVKLPNSQGGRARFPIWMESTSLLSSCRCRGVQLPLEYEVIPEHAPSLRQQNTWQGTQEHLQSNWIQMLCLVLPPTGWCYSSHGLLHS